MTLTTTCPACDAEFDVEVTFGEPAATSGPPERCHDGSPDEVSADCCPECGERLDPDNLMKEAARVAEDRKMERDLARAEAREEARRYWFL